MSLDIVNGDAVLLKASIFTPTKCLHQPGAGSLNGDAVMVSGMLIGDTMAQPHPLSSQTHPWNRFTKAKPTSLGILPSRCPTVGRLAHACPGKPLGTPGEQKIILENFEASRVRPSHHVGTVSLLRFAVLLGSVSPGSSIVI